MKRKLFTIGYTGVGIEKFIEKLVRNDIECLIDVRELPISRKAGFAKTALTQHLSEVGINYRHFKPLGSPKALRHKVREDRKYPVFFKGVHRHLNQESGIEAMEQTIEIARSLRSCLMCCCPDWEHCHRKCLVEVIEESTTMTFDHLAFGDQQQTLWSKAA